MKKIVGMLLICGLFVIALNTTVNADTYTKKTPDDTVDRIEAVEVEIEKVKTEKQTLTLDQIDTQIAVEEKHIADYQASVVALTALRNEIELEAAKVKLKIE